MGSIFVIFFIFLALLTEATEFLKHKSDFFEVFFICSTIYNWTHIKNGKYKWDWHNPNVPKFYQISKCTSSATEPPNLITIYKICLKTFNSAGNYYTLAIVWNNFLFLVSIPFYNVIVSSKYEIFIDGTYT